MELKAYQQQVVNDIALFLDYIQEEKNVSNAFRCFWVNHPRTPLTPFIGQAIEPYKGELKHVPNITLKVPTAGGKTFIACNAIQTIFSKFNSEHTRMVVWLVPSISILEQTVSNLKNTDHPYRQKINTHFGNKVEVFTKQELLQGGSFNASTVRENLTILVLSFDSLRARNKEDRKLHQENGNLQSFEHQLKEDKELSFVNVVRSYNPLVIVDESHNAESVLSIEMLNNLNPCFVLDLTATPRKNSNIISFVDALELKKENMVKLPVIAYNHQNKLDVINSALSLQKKLEVEALAEHKKGGKYIRPIVLFQAQPRTSEDVTTFEMLKAKLVEAGIPNEHIKIKTAEVNELKGVDLMSPDCPVRYIITVNALKEGWDCPFAYILATIADRTSAIDVEQILGRILRQPYVRKHTNNLLNLSYVLTASNKFRDTLQNIVNGLNRSGFSSKDYRAIDHSQEDEQPSFPTSETDPLESILKPINSGTQTTINSEVDDIPAQQIIKPENINDTTDPTLTEITDIANKESEEFEQKVIDIEQKVDIIIPTELSSQVKTYKIISPLRPAVAELKLPQFYIKTALGNIFGNKEQLLDKDNLLEGFPLRNADVNIDFGTIDSELYKVDLDESKEDSTPSFLQIDGRAKDTLLAYILDPAHKKSRVAGITKHIMRNIGKMYPINDKDIQIYISRILENFTDEQFNHFAENEHSYSNKIKHKITSLAAEYAEQRFCTMLESDEVIISPSYQFAKNITPMSTAKSIVKSLYEKEAGMNGFEEEVINKVANLPNVEFWHRVIEKKGFKLNGYLNHYPDFIIRTLQGKIVVLETKGDHLDAEKKIKLGSLWEKKAGNSYRYYLVYKDREVEGAVKLDKFLEIMAKL